MRRRRRAVMADQGWDDRDAELVAIAHLMLAVDARNASKAELDQA
jgi:hypothetical protein